VARGARDYIFNVEMKKAAKGVMAVAVALTLCISLPASARQLYRYVNAEGNKVIAYQVPPEYVRYGYEVLSENGAVLRVVPAQLGDDERASLSEQERIARVEEEERERLRKWDETLLLRYSTVEDIEAARERALRELKIRVSILRGKQRSLKQQIENYQALAADQERMGRTVSEEHLRAIQDLRSEISATERAIADRQKEIGAVDAQYGQDIERFASLLDIVEMRRAMATDDVEG
jgi:vacuolar-type H+-ATPase subunit I/STV1